MTKPNSVNVPFRSGQLALLAAATLMLGGCMHKQPEPGTIATAPIDYRQRHPIVVQESNTQKEFFVGTTRGGLTADQRAEVGSLAQVWLREGTGVITAEVPQGTPNARAASDSMREIQSILHAGGVPPRGIVVRNYHPHDPRQFATIRLNYPRIAADAGPCGLWPEDLGSSLKNKGYLSNQPYHNLGCAHQRNLAAMIANPADLVQPRAESDVYTRRRTTAFDKYRQGTSTATTYPEANTAKISDTGK